VVNENLVPRDLAYHRENSRRSSDFFARFVKQDVTPKRPFSTTINRSIQEVSAILDDIQNLPLFLENLEEIESIVDGRYQWRFRNEENSTEKLFIPMSMDSGRTKNGYVWETEDGVGFRYSMAILLEPASAGRGTVARIMVLYDSIAGDLVSIFEKIFGNDADIMAKKNLQRLKAFCEIGHVPTTVGQPSGRDEDQPLTLKH
jgi:uncharacterized membrane protein